MKRHPVLVAALVLVALLIGALAWLVETPSGARWCLSMVSRLTPLRISARTVEGRLAGNLHLEGVSIGWPAGSAQSASVRLNWRPLLLFTGRIQIDALTVKGLDIREKTSPKKVSTAPFRLIWPDMSGIPAMIGAKIDRLRVTDMVFRSGGEKPARIDRLEAELSWREGGLAIRRLQVAGPLVILEGEVAAGFVTPSLKADLALALPRNAMAKHLSLKADLSAPGPAKPLTGTLRSALVPASDRIPRLQLSADLRVERTALVVRHFALQAPGRKATIDGRGTLNLAGKTPSVKLRANLHHLDLAAAAHIPTDLSATLELAGTRAHYQGTFALSNRGHGWRSFELSGPFSGDAAEVALTDLAGRWLKGRMGGDLHVGWAGGKLAVHGTLRAENLDPSVIRAEWPGRINAALEARFERRGKGPPMAEMRGKLLKSTLRGRTLNGDLQARLAHGDLQVQRAVLRGAGFEASAHGSLKERLVLSAEVKNVSGLIPQAGGSFQASGWVRRTGEQWSGSLSGKGRQLSYHTLKAGRIQLDAEKDSGKRLALVLTAQSFAYGRLALDRAKVSVKGRPDDHAIRLEADWPRGRVRAEASGGYAGGAWTGKILSLEGKTAQTGGWRLLNPVAMAASSRRLRLSPATFRSDGGERLEVSADISPHPRAGTLRARWRDIRLAHANTWFHDLTLSGSSSGHAEVHLTATGRLKMTGDLHLSGKLSRGDLALEIRSASAAIRGGGKGLSASMKIELAEGGHLEGTLNSPGPLRLELPQGGSAEISVGDIGLKKAQLFLPANYHLEGKLSGRVKGRLLPGHRVDLQGKINLAQGHVQWEGPGKRLSVDLRTAELGLSWNKETLGGDLRLVLADYGRVQGDFQAPLPARLPTALKKDGPIRAHLSADMKEKGILSAILPGLVRESRGRLKMDLRVAGTWQRPDTSGNLELTGGAAFLPTAGIHLKKVALRGHFAGQQIDIDSVRATSGDGHLQGSAQIHLDRWHLASYRGTVKGEKFQAIDLPELRVEISPDLKLEGTAKKLKVRGKIQIPHLLATGFKNRAPVQPSPDVVLVGKSASEKKPLPMAVDLQIHIVLGKHVLVKAMGADARLEGAVTVTATGAKNVTAQGEIRVAEGTFSSYGVQLKITRGQVLFAGGPVDRPTLDILATRTVQVTATGAPSTTGPQLPTTGPQFPSLGTQTSPVGPAASGAQVTVGVHVTGTPRSPNISLYSEPAMSDSDILAYIVLGHPFGAESGQANLLMLAAGGLLSQGQSAVLQDKIKGTLGLSTLSIESGGGNARQSMVTLGKYLTPELYLSFSQSLLTKTRQVRLRYDFFKSWEIESEMGQESGIDLYYKIEFK